MMPLLLLLLLLEWGMPAADRKTATDWNQMTDKDWEKTAAQWEEGDQLAELITDDQALFNEMEMRQQSAEFGTPPAEYSLRYVCVRYSDRLDDAASPSFLVPVITPHST